VDKRQNFRKACCLVSFLVLSIAAYYISPYLIILAAMRGVVGSSLIIFFGMFVLSIFFGRLLCAYVCPIGGMQDCLTLLPNFKKAKVGWRNLIKYIIWTPWIILITIMFIRAGGILQVDFYAHRSLPLQPTIYIFYYSAWLVVVTTTLIMGKRAFCHYLCWMAPFMVIGSKISDVLRIPKLQLKSTRDNCFECGNCSDKCSMSLNVKQMVSNDKINNTECVLCGECVDTCPKKVISYSFKR